MEGISEGQPNPIKQDRIQPRFVGPKFYGLIKDRLTSLGGISGISEIRSGMRISPDAEDRIGYEWAQEDLIRQAKARGATHLLVTKRFGVGMYTIEADTYRHVNLGASPDKS